MIETRRFGRRRHAASEQRHFSLATELGAVNRHLRAAAAAPPIRHFPPHKPAHRTGRSASGFLPWGVWSGRSSSGGNMMAIDGAELRREVEMPRVETLRGVAGRNAGFQSLGEIPLQICCRCSVK